MTHDNTERPLETVATCKESLQVEPVGDMLEGWTCKPLYTALREAALDEPCFCDRNGIGAAGVSCGDCPTRDYKNPGR
jgi:hypothetical protein